MSNQANPLPEDQISPKEIIKKIIGFKDLFVKNWKVIAIFVILGAIGGWIYDYTHFKRPRYLGFLTFNLETATQGPSTGGLSDLASAFGIGGGGGTEAGGLFSGQNFIELVKSRPLLERALMTEVTIKGKKYLLVNYYIEKSGILLDEWEDNEKFQKIRFKAKPREQFTLDESVAMQVIVKKISEEFDFVKNNPKSSFTVLKCNTEDEMLSKIWLETLIETISEQYRETTTKKSREILRITKRRVDSLASVMAGVDASLANFQDRNQGLVSQQGMAIQQKLARNSSLVSSMYYQAVQSWESARFGLVKDTPLIQIIEAPVLPLPVDVYNFGKNIKAGAVIGVLLAIVFIFIRNAVKEIMNG